MWVLVHVHNRPTLELSYSIMDACMPMIVLLILLHVAKGSFLLSHCLAQCRDRQPIAVVDLGETCANIKAFASIVKQGGQAMLYQMLGLQANMPAHHHTLFRLEEGQIWVKLRPGVHQSCAGCMIRALSFGSTPT